MSWVVFELTPQGEDEDPDVLRNAVQRMFKNCEVFIPASVSIVGDSRMVHKLIDNYVFVRKNQEDAVYFKAEGSKYIASVLTVPNGKTRRLSVVTDADILKMKRQIEVETQQGIDVGDDVEIMSKAYKRIHGKVIEEIKETASVQVYINLRSKQAIVTLPRNFMRFVPVGPQSEAPTFAPFLTKLYRVREWAFRSALIFQHKTPDFSSLLAKLSEIKRMHPWAVGVHRLVPLITVGRYLTEVHRLDVNPLCCFAENVDLIRRAFVLEYQVTYSLPALSSVQPLERSFESVQKLYSRAAPYEALCKQIKYAETLAQYDTTDQEEIERLTSRLEVLSKVVLQSRMLKYQLSKIEASLRTAEKDYARRSRKKKPRR